MNIAVDTTFFGHKEVKNGNLINSVSLFTADLLDGFSALGKSDCFTLIVSEGHAAFFKERFPQYRRLVLKWLPFSLLYKISGGALSGTKYIKKFGIYKKMVKRENFDLIWFPYTVSYSAVRTNVTSVFTVHDMFRYHELNETYGYDWISDKRNYIAAISACTKNDIQQTLGYEKEIAVIPNSVRLSVFEQQEVLEVKKPFILDINAYIEKKNPITLLKAFSIIHHKTKCSLVFCGGYKDERLFRNMQDFIAEHNLEQKVHLLFRISEKQKNWLLQNATLFVTPSLYEGFGRTPVEAAICGVPVISTKETSLFEATAGLVHYIEDAKNPNEYAQLILKVLSNPDSKEELSKISETLKNEYATETCAKKYLELFMNILGRNANIARGGVITY